VRARGREIDTKRKEEEGGRMEDNVLEYREYGIKIGIFG